ncbi:MAG TPA: tRNA uridine-5-carboxymethylaminomethyl(34) synthesis enzyme MnmG [bacterium]|nr:tRNA uridine-5-carboxymethylaminomethyl(34) synthesis enzyme MnmG [bacterium]HPR86497.1 tRNA uridine-5-carboxymethylaminomethyl(34) synthesis enzyme MnmG [bacterium]
MKTHDQGYEVIVIGGGHAGCEAALAAARMGAATLLITQNIFTLGQMSCNPAIGGLAKGHLVKEIDALGGAMGRVADESAIQFRMLNRSKGPAVWSPRTQNDRLLYASRMRQLLEAQPGLTLRQHSVKALLLAGGRIQGVITEVDTPLRAERVILCAGTFLNGLIHVGMSHFSGGRSGELPATGLTEQLRAQGLRSGRLKTGTPPRLDGRTIDFSAMTEQPGDARIVPFSHHHAEIDYPQLSCYLTRTGPATHAILRSGLDRSPLYQGVIQGVGPRYCPSIEDKIHRFADKESHQLFLEPEGHSTREYYLNGFSTSLPEDIQIAAVRSIPGLKRAHLTRLGYAIEYDYFFPSQLWPTLESKVLAGLYLAGQINGTSGYEEAAAQGLMAGINAVRALRGEPPFILSRQEAYIGVLIDDLVTKELAEPYRMFTSLAENRLHLRQDNAGLRLMAHGYDLGLIDAAAWQKCECLRQEIAAAMTRLEDFKPAPAEINPLLQEAGSAAIEYRESAAQLLKRPQLRLEMLAGLWPDPLFAADTPFWREVREEVEIEVKYAGFLQRQQEQIRRMAGLEETLIPAQIDYTALTALSHESREKLQRIRPRTLGQASRILGVAPEDVATLLIHIARWRRGASVPRGTPAAEEEHAEGE